MNPLKCITNITVFDEHIDMLPLMLTIGNELKYKTLYRTQGVHREANRPHQHVMTIWECGDNKAYKALNKKINILAQEIYQNIIMKVTFTYNNGVKSNSKNEYSENCMMYPYKEYKSDADINYNQQFGYTVEHIHNMRKIAHQEWNRIKENKAKEECRKKLEQNKKLGLYEYLTQHTHHMLTSTLVPTEKVRETARLILKYKLTLDEGFKLHDLKNQSVNYLYKYNKLTEDEVLDLANI